MVTPLKRPAAIVSYPSEDLLNLIIVTEGRHDLLGTHHLSHSQLLYACDLYPFHPTDISAIKKGHAF